jgi:multicomponent Na+:H+ antiporter subunit E
VDSDEQRPLTRAAISALLQRWLVLYVLWLVISAADPSALIVGAIIAAGGAWLSIRLLPVGASRLRLRPVLGLVPAFAWRSLLGGVDVAWRALHPRMPLAPGWLVYRTRLPHGAARVTFGNEISLTPGTLAAGGHEDDVFVHCLDRHRPVAAMVEREERRVAACIGIGSATSDE